ncbi:MAG: LytR C-terminal domain-containing protein, partial [Cyanobacteria bacterium J06628_6]
SDAFFPEPYRGLEASMADNAFLFEHASLHFSLALAGFGLQLESDALNLVMLPGEFSDPDEYRASYWLLDGAASDEVMAQFFDAEPEVTLADDAPRRTVSRLRIAVQNATDDPIAAQTVADFLREEGFRNVYIINDWPDERRQTQVIAQRGDLYGASIVESVLGMGQVAAESTGDLDSDITIRVGEDWVEQTIR